MDNVKILAIVGMSGSGKSVVVDYLTEKGYPKVYFGGMIYKEMEKRGIEPGTVENMGEGEDFEFVTEYQDSSAAKGKTYYYKVVAKSWWNESAMSSYVKIKSK